MLETHTIYDENEVTTIVSNTIHYYKEQAEEYEKLYKEWKKKGMELANEELIDQIQSLMEDIKLSYGEFSSKKELDAYNQFVQDHMHNRVTSKINSGKVPYLIPTHVDIGTILHVKCPICGEEKDITDTEAW